MRLLIFAILISSYIEGYSQTPITLTNQTIKVGSLAEENFYYGFKEGDIIRLDFNEERKKGLKKVEVIAYPNQVIYSEYEPVKIEANQIVVPKTGVYKFRFYNASLSKRIAKVQIQRIPEFENENFNSTVYWETVYDTTYTSKKEEYILKEGYVAKSIIDNSEIFINSGSNATFKGGKSRVIYKVLLPQNTVEWYYEISAYREKETIQKVTSTMSLVGQLSKIVDGNGILDFALNSISVPPGDNYCDVYLFADYENAKLFEQKLDDRWLHFPAANRKNIKSDVVKLGKDYNNGSYYIGIKNPDSMHGINVRLEVVAVVFEREIGTRIVKVPVIKSRKLPYLESN